MKKILAALLFAFTIPAQAAPRQVPAGYVDYTMTDAVTASAQTGHVNCYAKTDGRRYCRDSSGTERKVPYSGEIGNADVTPSAGIAYSKLNLADSIVNADINSAAAIVDTKLATISTAGKVANSATTATSSAGTNTIVMRDANGDFVADKIQHEEELLVKQISTPSNPSAGYVSIYTKSDDKVYKKTSAGVESEIGSGGGGGSGINLITFDTAANSWTPTKQDNFNLDALVGDWVAYADAAGTEPVDMTGGSPGTTCTRSTSSPLNGSGSLFMDLGSGSSRQGEGCSVLVNVPPAYRGKNVAFTFPFSITGTNVEDDFKLYAYDVTNSLLITPFQKGKLTGTDGQAIAVLGIPTSSAQIRVGMHVARTSTASASIKADDFQVSPQIPAQGAIITKWTAYTPNYTGFGDVTDSNIEWRRNGDSLELRGSFVSGVATASLATMSLPPGLTAAAMVAHPQKAGSWTQSTSLAGNGMVLISSGESVIEFGYETGSQAGLLENNGNGIISNGVRLSLNGVAIPIAGWESNVTISESSTFWISSFLANGSHTTSTPTKLGEYRCYRKSSGNSNSFTTEAPSVTPSVANGMRIYAIDYVSNGTSGQCSVYEIFIGKKRSFWKLEAYDSTGKSGNVATDYSISGTTAYGLRLSYNPANGILYVDGGLNDDSSINLRQLGRKMVGGSGSNIADGYFDIQVSENALAVTSQPAKSKIVNDGWGGVGATNTNIGYFSSSTPYSQVGSAITYTRNTTLGDTWTINEDGMYSISLTLRNPASIESYAITLNNSSNAVSASNLTASDGLLAGCRAPSDFACNASWSGYLPKGSVIRIHTNGNATAAATVNSFLTIEKIGNGN